MQRHWFLCNKEMSENPKNRSKQLILKEKIFVSSEQLQKLNEIFRKDVTYDNITSHKKPGHRPLSRRYIFGKTTEGRVKLTPSSSPFFSL